ncbi:unnamed protein product [Ilex paraguariensis]|uniref:Uncharacterized protein n=1 Tax=Ilex paraguariensis TaxID=185542 RepID=A0ABC8S5S7_9AQUA
MVSTQPLSHIPPKPPDLPHIPTTTPRNSLILPPKPPGITQNFASLFKKSAVNGNLHHPPAASTNLLPFFDPLSFNITNPMPLFPQAHQLHPTPQPPPASLSPTSANPQVINHNPSPELGIHTHNTPTNIQIAHGVNANPHSLLNLHIQSSSNEPSSVRLMPHSPFPSAGQGNHPPISILNVQYKQGAQSSPTSINFGSFISANATKPSKRVVLNNGEPGMYWSPDETQELSKDFSLSLIGKCAYGKPSLGVDTTDPVGLNQRKEMDHHTQREQEVAKAPANLNNQNATDRKENQETYCSTSALDKGKQQASEGQNEVAENLKDPLGTESIQDATDPHKDKEDLECASVTQVPLHSPSIEGNSLEECLPPSPVAIVSAVDHNFVEDYAELENCGEVLSSRENTHDLVGNEAPKEQLGECHALYWPSLNSSFLLEHDYGTRGECGGIIDDQMGLICVRTQLRARNVH